MVIVQSKAILLDEKVVVGDGRADGRGKHELRRKIKQSESSHIHSLNAQISVHSIALTFVGLFYIGQYHSTPFFMSYIFKRWFAWPT